MLRFGRPKKDRVPIPEAQNRHPVPKLEAQKGTLFRGTSPVLPSMEMPPPPPGQLNNLNFHPLEVVSRYRNPQLQVNENYSQNLKKYWCSNTHFIHNNSDTANKTNKETVFIYSPYTVHVDMNNLEFIKK